MWIRVFGLLCVSISLLGALTACDKDNKGNATLVAAILETDEVSDGLIKSGLATDGVKFASASNCRQWVKNGNQNQLYVSNQTCPSSGVVSNPVVILNISGPVAGSTYNFVVPETNKPAGQMTPDGTGQYFIEAFCGLGDPGFPMVAQSAGSCVPSVRGGKYGPIQRR